MPLSAFSKHPLPQFAAPPAALLANSHGARVDVCLYSLFLRLTAPTSCSQPDLTLADHCLLACLPAFFAHPRFSLSLCSLTILCPPPVGHTLAQPPTPGRPHLFFRRRTPPF